MREDGKADRHIPPSRVPLHKALCHPRHWLMESPPWMLGVLESPLLVPLPRVPSHLNELLHKPFVLLSSSFNFKIM